MLMVPALAQENLGARPMGMGGAWVAMSDDVNAIFINPAGIAGLKRESVMAATRLQEGREYTMIGGVETTPFGNLGIGYIGSSDPIEGTVPVTTYDGDSPVKYTTQTLYITMARDLNQAMRVPASLGSLQLGMNVKLSSRKIGIANGLAQDGGSSVDLDLATIFKPNGDLSLGLAVQNFMGNDKSAIANLSTVDRKQYAVLAGAAGRLFDGNVTWTVEGEELGCEWTPVKGLALRTGRSTDCTTTGLGISVGGINLDYAYLNRTSPVHYWSVSILPEPETSAKRAGLNEI
ncbi:MAG: hypothetical protein MUC35_06020 [Candidatus Margulisbacteria bacterium]|nr:hypothetical protein [Candidatus Margulisiibacteriota bacterium]